MEEVVEYEPVWPGLIRITAAGNSVVRRGWLDCNGQAVSRKDYAKLFAVIGTTYGSGDGFSTFNVPDKLSSVENLQYHIFTGSSPDQESLPS